MNGEVEGIKLTIAYLGLGSNLGDREVNIREAIHQISETSGVRLLCESSLYESVPMGVTDQPDFVNAVVRVETDLTALGLLRSVLAIEENMGRVRNFMWGPRVIDIDLLLYGALEMDTPELVLPHPRMYERAFVMEPLMEIAPNLRSRDGRDLASIVVELKGQRVNKLPEAS